MVYSRFIRQKAQDLGVDLNDPVGGLIVCRRLLEGLSWRFRGDWRKVIVDIDGLEGELREIRVVLTNIQQSQMAVSFLLAGYITSIDGILQGVNQAYSLICAASMALGNGSITAVMYNEVFQSFTLCQNALASTLQEFCIS